MAKRRTRPSFVATNLPAITDSFVQRVARPESGADFYFDRSRTGFGVKIYAPNQDTNKPSKRVYGIRVTIEGNKKRWITIGPHGDMWTADTAKEEARKIKLNIEEGRPPFSHRPDRKAALYRLEDLAKSFFAEFKNLVKQGLRSPGTHAKYERQWDNNVPVWLKKTEVLELKASLLKKALKEISHPKDRKPRPVEGNRTLAMLSAMLGWVMEQDPEDRMGLTENHCDGVERNKESGSCGVWMEDADQAKLLEFLTDPQNRRDAWWTEEKHARDEAKWHGLKRKNHFQPPYLITDQMANALLLLFISGLRSWEVMALRWDDIHGRSQSISVIQTKQGGDPGTQMESKRIYISEEVQGVLDRIPKTSEWVFPSNGRVRKAESGHMENMQDSWERIRKHLGLPSIRLHDYRHTAASEVGDCPVISVKDLQTSFGWKTEQTAMRYLHSRAKARDQRIQEVTTSRLKRIGLSPFADAVQGPGADVADQPVKNPPVSKKEGPFVRLDIQRLPSKKKHKGE
jgi:hypothetical protein